MSDPVIASASLEAVAPSLHATPPQRLSFARTLGVRAYLLVRPRGNLSRTTRGDGAPGPANCLAYGTRPIRATAASGDRPFVGAPRGRVSESRATRSAALPAARRGLRSG